MITFLIVLALAVKKRQDGKESRLETDAWGWAGANASLTHKSAEIVLTSSQVSRVWTAGPRAISLAQMICPHPQPIPARAMHTIAL